LSDKIKRKMVIVRCQTEILHGVVKHRTGGTTLLKLLPAREPPVSRTIQDKKQRQTDNSNDPAIVPSRICKEFMMRFPT
jgi:hypothetical protein